MKWLQFTMWTEERIERLKTLWADGLSASQIAARLGGITRNAVIGKVHRLGLAGRATTSRRYAPRLRRRTAPDARKRVVVTALLPTSPRTTLRACGNLALKPALAHSEANPETQAVVPSPVEELNMPAAMRVGLLDLTDSMCRWPIGAPQDEHFHFCGYQKGVSGSYCEHHTRIAHQPYTRRTKK